EVTKPPVFSIYSRRKDKTNNLLLFLNCRNANYKYESPLDIAELNYHSLHLRLLSAFPRFYLLYPDGFLALNSTVQVVNEGAGFLWKGFCSPPAIPLSVLLNYSYPSAVYRFLLQYWLLADTFSAYP